MAYQVSSDRLHKFIDASTKYFNWETILRDSQIKEVADKGDQFEIKCILHEDKRPSLRLNKVTGVYHCFSCGCSGTYTKFLWELSGKAVGYAEYCEQILKAHPAMQAKLGFTSLYISEKTLDPAFNQRRVFNKQMHAPTAMSMSTLSSKMKSLDNSWQGLASSLSLLQKGMNTDGVYQFLKKQHIEVEQTSRINLMDLF